MWPALAQSEPIPRGGPPAAWLQPEGPLLSRAVGGIAIDPDGLLENARVDDLGRLQRERAAALEAAPAGMSEPAPLRKVSLGGLEAAIRRCRAEGVALPDEIRYLAGLQQVRYVLAVPEQHDILLVGPAEGWKLDPHGEVVGATTGRPVMLLDDLLVAMRSLREAARGGITCSIDPTREGLERLRAYVATRPTIGQPEQTLSRIEQALGRQRITVTGVPTTSHFARVLVAADYRMKRLAMDFEPAPIAGLPSFLSMVRANGRGMSNVLPRWWLAPNYEPMLRSPDGLAWEFRGASVKAMTENDFLAAGGAREHTGRADPVAQKWADTMTRRYDDLAGAEPVFGQLRNCMDLALVAALVVGRDLAGQADFNLGLLLDDGLPVQRFAAPAEVDSKASVLKKGSNWIISASGGVRIDLGELLRDPAISDVLGSVSDQARLGAHGEWWWN
jgi:hypothetical protein